MGVPAAAFEVVSADELSGEPLYGDVPAECAGLDGGGGNGKGRGATTAGAARPRGRRAVDVHVPLRAGGTQWVLRGRAAAVESQAGRGNQRGCVCAARGLRQSAGVRESCGAPGDY